MERRLVSELSTKQWQLGGLMFVHLTDVLPTRDGQKKSRHGRANFDLLADCTKEF